MKDFFNNVYKVLIEKRTDFAGRSTRKEYWSSWLFIQLTSIFLLIFAFRARPLFLIFILFSILIIIPSSSFPSPNTIYKSLLIFVCIDASVVVLFVIG